MNKVFTLLLIALPLTGYSQITVSGKVVDESGNPVPLASIQSLRLKKKGVSADRMGNFKLEEVPNRDTLVCTHINYESKSEEVFGNNYIVFRLRKKSSSLTNMFINSYSGSIHPQSVTKNIVADTARKEDIEIVFEKLELPAHFGKDSNSLRHYFEKNIIFPDSTTVSLDATGEFEGNLKVHYIIDETGKAVNITILKGISNEVDEAVREAIIKMPLWNPAIQNGMAVESGQELSIYVRVNHRKRYR